MNRKRRPIFGRHRILPGGRDGEKSLIDARLAKIDGDSYHLARIDEKVAEGKKRILAELGLEE
ncbi:MAG: hypothetical protein V3R83_09635 [Gammaproteobacteria bacterium]